VDRSSEDSPQQPTLPAGLPPFPKIWLGYLLGLATSVAEIVAIKLHPDLLQAQFPVPPLYLFLANFLSLVFWMVSVYELHTVVAFATGGEYSIKPVRAAWFHLLPVYGLFWVYKWPRELAKFVNTRLPSPLMKPQKTGYLVFLAFVVFLVLARGLGMILLFWALSYLSTAVRLTLVEPPAPVA
jgi:hypothetical protein